MAVSMVHIHHEGGGAPCTAAQCDRFSEGGYCYGIGTDTFRRWRSPADNYATADWNHRDLTLCFSGSRGNTNPAYDVSDHDIAVLHDAFMDSYNRNEVTGNPQVVAHRNAGGSNATACPGDNAMARWNDIVNACQATAPTPPKPPVPEDDVTDLASAINHDNRPVIVQVGGDSKLYFKIRDASGGGWSDWRDLSMGFTNFATVTAYINPTNKAIDVWVTMKDGKSFETWQLEPDFAKWQPWQDRTR